MTIFYIILIACIMSCLVTMRMAVVLKAASDWTYYVYKYKHHCRLHYTEEEKPLCRINENELTRGEAILVFLMFWKINPAYFFDFKPDWDDIHELYILKE